MQLLSGSGTREWRWHWITQVVLNPFHKMKSKQKSFSLPEKGHIEGNNGSHKKDKISLVLHCRLVTMPLLIRVMLINLEQTYHQFLRLAPGLNVNQPCIN